MPDLGRLFRLAQKELRETLRDRRTIGTLLLMPLLVYPALSLVMQRFLVSAVTSGPVEAPQYRLGVIDESEGRQLHEILGESRLRRSPEAGRPEPVLSFGIPDGDPQVALKQRDVEALVRIYPTKPPSRDPTTIEIAYLEGDALSQEVARFIGECVESTNVELLSAQLRQVGVDDVVPIKTSRSRVDGDSAPLPMLATIVPLVLVLMTITGAVYPAIDLTAGERERGTIEAVMASPVSRTTLLLSKYVAVVTVALLTAFANLWAMLLTLWGGGFLELLLGKGALSFSIFLQVFGLLVLLASFFAGVLLALTSFARSFKEAQAYLIPVMLMSLAPGILSLTPDVQLEGVMTVVPLANVVLLVRDVLTSQVDATAATMTVLSTLVYALAGVAIASQLFGADALTRGSEESLATLFKRPREPQLRPTIARAVFGIALLVPSYYVASGVLGRLAGESMAQRLNYSFTTAAILFGLLPVLVLWAGRIKLVSGFRFRRFSAWVIPGVVLLGISLWPFAYEAFLLTFHAGLDALNPELVSKVERLRLEFSEQPLWRVLFAFALAPAIFEELTFRGFLLSALEVRMSHRRAILLSSVAFGVFHVISGSALTPERFVPSTMLGIVLGWVAIRTQSVVPGMILHGTHNALLLTAGTQVERIKSWGIDLADQKHLPLTWLAIAIGISVMGFVWIYWASRSREFSRT